MLRNNASPPPIQVMTAVVILGTFLCGAAVGTGVYRWATPHHPPPPPMGLPLHELDLTAAQDAAARQIAERHRAELDAILQQTYPKVRAINDQIEKEIRQVLTPEQQRRLDQLKARRPPHHGPHHGPPPFGPPPFGGGPFGGPGDGHPPHFGGGPGDDHPPPFGGGPEDGHPPPGMLDPGPR